MIYFIRHGESEANKKGVFAGQKDDSDLTSNGEIQAIRVAENILDSKLSIEVIVSSPLDLQP